jgi:hypothetical protein
MRGGEGMTNESFTPPPVPGYVFAGNSGLVDRHTGKNMTEELATQNYRRWLFDQPSLDEMFTLKVQYSGCEMFATYVREEYSGLVEQKKEYLREMLDVLEFFFKDEE